MALVELLLSQLRSGHFNGCERSADRARRHAQERRRQEGELTFDLAGVALLPSGHACCAAGQ